MIDQVPSILLINLTFFIRIIIERQFFAVEYHVPSFFEKQKHIVAYVSFMYRSNDTVSKEGSTR